MNLLLMLFLIGATATAITYLQLSLAVATVVAAVSLYFIGWFASGYLSGAVMYLAWIGWLFLLGLNVRSLRQRFVTGPAFELFREAAPSMSRTERDALEAGTVWWDAELFSGAPNWQRLLATPKPELSGEEAAFLANEVEQLCSMVDEWQASMDGHLADEVWRFIKDSGILGIIIPKAYGGKEFSAYAHSQIMTKIASRSGTAAATCMVPNSLGPAELLLRYGEQAQKDHYLPKLASGEHIPCFGLTNPLAGSDAANIPDFGVVCRGVHEGEEVLGIRVTFEKRYITLGPIATVLGVAFQLQDPEGLLGEEGCEGITLALIPAEHPGIETGRRHFPSRQPFQNGPLNARDVFIPISWVIGGQARCGNGWRMLMNCLAAGRSISLPAGSTGALKLSAYTSGLYCGIRKQFNVTIGNFEGIQERLARLAAETYVVDSARRLTASALDAHEEPSVISALLKYQATERMRNGVIDAMDVHGGRGVCDGPSNYLYQAYAAAPVSITVEGANILTRSLIVFGQGAVRCHPWVLKEIDAAEQGRDGLAAFDAAILGHVGHVLSNASRALVRGVTGGVLGSDPSVGEVNYWYAQLERASAAFAFTADVAMAQLGGALKRKEMLSGRLADIFSELYLLSAALKRFEDGARNAIELPIIEYTMTRGLYEIEQRLDEITRNLPNRWLASLCRFVIFPLGRRARPVSDRQTSAVARQLVDSEDFRNLLCDGIYLNDDQDDAVGCLEHARRLIVLTKDLDDRLMAAIKEGRIAAFGADVVSAAVDADVLTSDEAELLNEMRAALRRAIDVDEFDADELWSSRAATLQTADAA